MRVPMFCVSTFLLSAALSAGGCSSPSAALRTDVTTAYYFRGIPQEDRGLILQPAASVSVPLSAEDGAPVLALGAWASIHDERTGAAGDAGLDAFYELDIYGTLAFEPVENVSVSPGWTTYSSPNDAFRTVHEVSLGLSFDDAPLWDGGFSLRPSALVAWEIENSAFGPSEGAYLEVGVEPEIPALGEAVRVYVPLKTGWSITDYYETASDDDTFGYGSIGVRVEVQLGDFALHGRVDWLLLGDNLKNANGGDRSEVLATIGVSLSL